MGYKTPAGGGSSIAASMLSPFGFLDGAKLRQNGPVAVLAAANQTPLTTKVPYGVGVPVFPGDVITAISWLAGNTALVTGVNQWCALYNGALALLGVTNNDAANAWAANALKTFTLVSPYTVPGSWTPGDPLYPTLVVEATTVPSLGGGTLRSGALAVANALGGNKQRTVQAAALATATPVNAPNPLVLSGNNAVVAWCGLTIQ